MVRKLIRRTVDFQATQPSRDCNSSLDLTITFTLTMSVVTKHAKSFTPVRVWLHERREWFVGAVFHISGCRCLREKCWVELSVHCSIWWQSRDLINTNSTSVSISRRWALALASTRTIFSWLWSGLDSHPVWNTALQLNNPNVLTSLSHSINIRNQWLWQR